MQRREPPATVTAREPYGRMPAQRMRVQLLDADPELGQRLDSAELRAARARLVVATLFLDPGPWHPDRAERPPGHLGFLILDGMIVREVQVGGGKALELLNSGDLLRPWLEDAASFVDARWTVISPVRLAVLDPPTAAALSRWPAVIEELIDRGMRRSRSLAVSAAVQSLRGVDERLWVLFWHLAERWGKREADGAVILPLDLTHETLAILVGARRPSVSTAISRLTKRGWVERVQGTGWRLRGEPPFLPA
jgi:CRP/FNR family transcriptional regulator, cyclic AMP receptor protein